MRSPDPPVCRGEARLTRNPPPPDWVVARCTPVTDASRVSLLAAIAGTVAPISYRSQMTQKAETDAAPAEP